MMGLHSLCRVWAMVFAVTGLGFAIAPWMTAEILNEAAGLLGLTPGIPVARDSLWYVLALSLMATITYLAWEAGARGAPPQMLRALILSKLVSTAGYGVAAVTLASGWWLCAGADGFVAVTLLVARRFDRTALQ